MKNFLKRIRYLKLLIDLICAYLVSIGVISFISIFSIINNCILPKEAMGFAFFFRTVNIFFMNYVVFCVIIIVFEIFILGKHRYLKGDCVFITLNTKTIAQANEQAIIEIKKKQDIPVDIERLEAIEFFQCLRNTSAFVDVLIKK